MTHDRTHRIDLISLIAALQMVIYQFSENPPPTLLGLLGELIPQLPCNANTALGPFSACFVQFSVWHVCMLPSYYLFYLYEVLD